MIICRLTSTDLYLTGDPDFVTTDRSKAKVFNSIVNARNFMNRAGGYFELSPPVSVEHPCQAIQDNFELQLRNLTKRKYRRFLGKNKFKRITAPYNPRSARVLVRLVQTSKWGF